jgi:hypothetical protein
MPIVMYVVILVAVSRKSKKRGGNYGGGEYRESVNGLETSWCTARGEMEIRSGEGIRNHGKGNSLKVIKIYVRKKTRVTRALHSWLLERIPKGKKFRS